MSEKAKLNRVHTISKDSNGAGSTNVLIKVHTDKREKIGDS